MNLKHLQLNWEAFGKSDPLWAILTCPGKRGNKWNRKEFFETGRQAIDGLIVEIKAHGLLANTGRALDFGCGVGRITQALAHYFDRVDGVDIAQSMLDLAAKYNAHGRRCRYVLNESDELGQFPNQAFDLIYSVYTLQHMRPEYSKRYIREFLRILALDGLLVFHLPIEPIRETRTPSRWIKDLVKAVVPVGLRPRPLNRGGVSPFCPKEPRMEMYGIRRGEIERLLKDCGGVLVDFRKAAFAGWVFGRYCVKLRAGH